MPPLESAAGEGCHRPRLKALGKSSQDCQMKRERRGSHEGRNRNHAIY